MMAKMVVVMLPVEVAMRGERVGGIDIKDYSL